MEKREAYVRKIGCCLGVIQGLTYAVLSLISIVLYNVDIVSPEIETYMDTVNIIIYIFFLGPNESLFADQTLRPKVFTAFVWIHFILNLAWISISIIVLQKKHLSTFWSCTTFLICTWDLITVIILGADYQKCLNFANEYYTGADRLVNQGYCANAILPVLVIAAKGFILWVVNMFCASVVLIWVKQSNESTPSSIDQDQADTAAGVVSTTPGTENSYPTEYPTLQYDTDFKYKQKPMPFNYTKPPTQQYPVSIPEPDYY